MTEFELIYSLAQALWNQAKNPASYIAKFVGEIQSPIGAKFSLTTIKLYVPQFQPIPDSDSDFVLDLPYDSVVFADCSICLIRCWRTADRPSHRSASSHSHSSYSSRSKQTTRNCSMDSSNTLTLGISDAPPPIPPVPTGDLTIWVCCFD